MTDLIKTCRYCQATNLIADMNNTVDKDSYMSPKSKVGVPLLLYCTHGEICFL